MGGYTGIMAIAVAQSTYRNREERAAFIRDEFPECLKGRVLDVGCGGALLRAFAEDYTGVDIEGHPDLTIDLERMACLPFEDGFFDCVVCTDVLEHLDNLHSVLEELIRVSDRLVLLSLPNMFTLGQRLLYLGGQISSRTYGLTPTNRHKWFYTFSQAREFVREKLGARLGLRREMVVASPNWKQRPLGDFITGAYPTLFSMAYWALLEKERQELEHGLEKRLNGR
jgi:SAM-dependent methyltransferase